MRDIRVAIGVIWALFWIAWLVWAFTAKRSVTRGSGARGRLVVWVLLILFFRVLRPHGLAIHSLPLVLAGLVLVLAGLGIAVWARLYLGRNWGMPTSMRAEPELITTGPYRWVRHPIYSGIILALLGTTLAFNLSGLVVAVLVGAMFYWSGKVEERNMTEAFPTQYPQYVARTKRLIPFVL